MKGDATDPIYFTPQDYACGLRMLSGELAISAKTHEEQVIFQIALGMLIDKRMVGGLAKAYEIAQQRAAANHHTDLLLVNELVWHFDILKLPDRLPAKISRLEWETFKDSDSLCYQLLAIRAAQDVGLTQADLLTFYQSVTEHPLAQMRFVGVLELLHSPIAPDTKKELFEKFKKVEAARRADGSACKAFRKAFHNDCTMILDVADAAESLMKLLEELGLF